MKALLQACLGAYKSDDDDSQEAPKEKIKKAKEPQIINIADDDEEKPEPKPVPRKEKDDRVAIERPRYIKSNFSYCFKR